MDIVKTLVRSVARAFLTIHQILVVEALVMHSALRDDDLGHLIKMNMKDLHRLCVTLREARFLVIHTRPEMVEGKTRPSNRTYYFIDYRAAIDAIKWRVYKTDQDMQDQIKPRDEKDYACPRCRAQFTELEVLDFSFTHQGFACQRCGTVLQRITNRDDPAHARLSRMNNQFKFMTDMLQQIDRMVVPECTFDKAFQMARPVVRDATNEARTSVPVQTGLSRPAAVKGLANLGPKTMHITISDGDDAQEKQLERERKAQRLRENALPSWMVTSAVPTTTQETKPKAARSFEMVDAGEDEDPARGKRPKVETMPAADGKDGDTSLKFEEEDEDELEFENVI